MNLEQEASKRGRSREGAWIEIIVPSPFTIRFLRRPREGAWIEISSCRSSSAMRLVAPVRERGLKLQSRLPVVAYNLSLP